MNSENLNKETVISDEISLKELILKIRYWALYLRSKWLIIVSFGILGAILGFTYNYLKKPIYVATTTFVLEDGDKGGGLGQYASLASMMGVDAGGGGGGIFQGDNILELYKSRKMIEKTLLTEVEYNGKKSLLIDLYIDFNKLRKAWDKVENLKDIKFESSNSKLESLNKRTQDSILGTIVDDINKKYLVVSKPDKKLSLIKAEVRSMDEFFSKVFNEQIVKNVNDFYLQTKTKKSLENISILQQKTDSVRSVMNGAIYTVAAVSDATPNLNPTRQVQRVAPIQRSQFNAEINKSILGELVKNLEMSKMSLRKEMPLIQVVDLPVFPLLKESSSKIKGSLLGAVLTMFLTIFILLFKKILKEIMA